MKKILLLLCILSLKLHAQNIDWPLAIEDNLLDENDEIELCTGNLSAFNSTITNIENKEFILTICPSNENEVIYFSNINVNWVSISDQTNEFSLEIYNGEQVDENLLLDFSTPAEPSIAEGLAATNEEGCLTILLKTGDANSVPGFPIPEFGFSLDITCDEACPNIMPIVALADDDSCGSQFANNVVVVQDEDFTLQANSMIDGFLTSDTELNYKWTVGNTSFEGNTVDLNLNQLGNVPASIIATNNSFCTSEILEFNIIVNEGQLSLSTQNTHYNLEELIAEVMIGGGACANVNNVNSPIQSPEGTSIGYFNKGCSDFPFEEGVVLGSGGIPNILGQFSENAWSEASVSGSGPNEQLLATIATGNNPTNSVNDVSAIDFEFSSFEPEVAFNYIFASYEYPSFVCSFADVFAFIISGPYDEEGNFIGGDFEDGTPGVYQDEYLYNHNANPNDDLLASNLGGLNIATVPDEIGNPVPTTPTNIHNNPSCGIGGLGEFYLPEFYSNQPSDYHNMGGETVALTAHAEVIPCTTYKMKLLIGDWNDTIMDSFVFIEGGSFGIGADLGDDLVPGNENLVCYGESQNLSIYENEISENCNLEVEWLKDGELLSEFNDELSIDVFEPGLYDVFIEGGEACVGSDQIQVQFLPTASFEYPFENICACDPNGNFEINLMEELDPFAFLNDNGQGGEIASNQNSLEDLGLEINFFTSEEDAIDFNNPLGNPEEYEVTQPTTIWVRVNESLSGEAKCPTIVGMDVLLAFAQRPDAIEENIQHLDECNLFTEEENIDLTINDAISLGTANPTEVIATYYEERNDALTKTNAIQNPENFSLPDGVDQSKIFVRLESSQSELCFNLVSFNVHVKNVKIGTFPLVDFYVCKEEGQTSNIVTFNLSDYDEIVLGEDQNASDYQINYFTSESRALNFTNPIIKPTQYLSDGETIWARISRNDDLNECFAIDNFELKVTEFGDPNCETFSIVDFENSFSLYPNPTSGKLIIEQVTQFEIQKIEIYSIQGKKLFQSNQQLKQIDLTNYTTGVYFVKLLVNNNWVTKKVIKK